MPPLPPFSDIAIEFIYSLVIIASCLIIYFSTKEIYDLTSHKGIRYFRLAFMFFAIAFFFWFVIKFLVISFHLPRILHIQPEVFGILSLFVYIYASTIAMFYLLYSVMWEKIDPKSKSITFFHVIALAVSFISIVIEHVVLLFLVQAAVFLYIAVQGYMSYKASARKKRTNHLYKIYVLLFVFWVLNILDILIPDFDRGAEILIYSVSALLFLLILHRVVKNTGLVRHG